MVKITSRNNDRVKWFLRERNSLRVFEGRKLVEDIQQRKANIEILIVLDECAGEVFCTPGTELWCVNESVMKKLTSLKSPPEMIAVVKEARRRVDLYKCNAILVLDNLQDPGNAGTIFRSAAGFGFDAVVMAGQCVSLNNPRFLRAAQTAVLDVHSVTSESTEEFLSRSELKKHNIYIASSGYLKKSVKPENMELPAVIVIGNEGQGVDSELLKRYKTVRIPQKSSIESLNAGVSASILMYELGKKLEKMR